MFSKASHLCTMKPRHNKSSECERGSPTTQLIRREKMPTKGSLLPVLSSTWTTMNFFPEMCTRITLGVVWKYRLKCSRSDRI